MGKNKMHTHRHYEEQEEWGCGNWMEYTFVVIVSCILLLGSVGLTIFWVMSYRGGFGWRDANNPEKQFNLHPVLMVAGFITFSGFSILLYRICRCCRRIYIKLLHTVFHALAIPCVAIGFIAVLEYHKYRNIPNFYSLHSWLGFVTMGLFAIQFVVGFFSFLILLCCQNATSAFRASLVPIHASFGLTTFMLAIATCLTGLTEKVFTIPGLEYSKLPHEGIVVNTFAMVLVALGILVSYAVRSPVLRVDTKVYVTERL